MPDKKYLIEIPGMPEGSGVWDADKWERNKDIFMEDYPDANVFELGAYDADDAKETDQIMLDLGIEEMSGVWDNAKWERNKDVFMHDHPEAKVSRVRYVDYWGQKAEQNRAQKALLQQPNEERNAKLAELGYYDDITGGQVDFSLNAPSVIGLKPLSSAVETTATGETTYHDPRVKEFFANDSAETDRLAEMARLDAEYDANPSVIAQREWEAQVLAERKAYASKLEKQIREDMESNVDVVKASRGATAKHGYDPLESQQMSYLLDRIAGDKAGSGETENEKLEQYNTALKFLEKAKIARDVASKGFGGAVVDWTKEGVMDLATQDDIEAYNEIGNILTKLEKKVGNLKSENLTEEVFDKYLTKNEQALIKAFYEYNSAMAEAQQDMSRAYKGGKIFAESVPFMLEFLATGGLYTGAGRAATSWMGKAFAKWIAKSAVKTTARAAKVATAKIVSGAVKAGAGTLARTVAAPGTYDRMAEASIKTDDEGHLHRAKESAVAFADMYVENLSEISGGLIGKGLGILGKGAGKLIAKTPLSKIGGLIGDNKFMQTLSKGMKDFMPKMEVLGFHGLPEEIGEEFIGNAIREVAHIQPGALKEMVSDDNFGAMLIGFAPMTLIGVAGGAISLGVVNAKAAKMGEDLRAMFSNTYSAAELDHMMGVIQNAQTAEEIQRALKPYAMAIANAEADGKISADEAAEQIEMLYQYGGFMAQNNALIFGKKSQDRQMMDAKREEFTNQYGRFWQEDQNETVQIATLNNGSTVFVTSAPAADGMIAIVDAMTGKKGFANVADILTQEVEGEEVKASNSLTMDAFLNSHIATQRKTAEETRMNNERNAQIEALAAQITPGTKINLGTEGSPVIVYARGTNKRGVVIVDETGMESTLGWEQAAYALGQPIKVETDQQKLDAEISERLQRMTERRMRRAVTPATEATAEAADEAAEVVAQEQQNIPLREDGTVDEALFWTQDPEGYVKWNDEQNKDGGQDSLKQIAISKQELFGMLNEAATGQNTSNPTMRKAAEKQVAAIAEKIARLEALEMSYADALAEEKEAVKQTQATPTATMSEEQLEQMDAQYQGILGKTRIQSERVRVMQEYLDKLAEDSVPVVLLTMQNYEERMKADGVPNSLINAVKKQVDAGKTVAGFMAAGKVYLMHEGLTSIEDGRVTYVHERQHAFNRANPQLVQRVADALGNEEAALAILKTFVNEKALETYKDDDLNALADEIICRSMEIVYSNEEFSVDLQSRGVPSEVISIITEIDNEQRQDQSLSYARRRGRRNSYSDVSGAGSVRQDGRDIEQISEGVLEQEETRPSGSSGGGTQTGEGAEVISDDDDASFRIVSEPEDPNGVTAEQNDEINRSVGGELEIGDENASIRFSVTAIGHGAGLELLKDDGEGNVALVLPDGRKFNANNLLKPEDLKSLPDSVLSYMMSDARALGNIDARKEWMLWNKYTLMLNAILSKGSAENGGFEHLASQWQWIADTVYKTVATNSDTQYSYSLDITRVCKKNEAVINAIAEMQARLGYGITPGQIMDIYMSTIEEGYQVPCPVCYVFSRYIRNGKYATIMINGQRKYGSKLIDPRTLSEEEKEKLIKYWLKELKKIQDQNEANENEINKANSDITVLLDEIDKLSKQITDPRSNLTEEQKETVLKKIHELDARYKAALNVVSQSSLDSWITQFAIYKKKEDGKEKWMLYEDSYMGFPEEMALDLRQTSTVMRLYPAIQRFRKSRGAAAGKEITFVSNNDLGDVALALGSKNATEELATPRDMSDKEWEELQKKENGALMVGQKNLYQQAYEEKDANKKAELLKKARERFASASEYAKRQSLRGGQRMWSWSDNIERLAPDVFVNLFQMELLGGALQSYSKQLEGIKLVASMNGYVNGSLMGKGNGYAEVSEENVEEVDGKFFLKGGDFVMTLKNGKKSTLRTPVYKHTDGKFYVLEFDDVVGIDAFGKDIDGKHYKGLFELNAEYDKAGNILVGMNDLHIRIAMADDRIFFIIPWHSSGANTHILAQMYDYLGVEYDVTLSQDYTDVQSEKRIKGAGEKEESSKKDKKGKEKKESTPVSTFLAEFWNDHYENAREYEGYGMVAGKDFACGIEGGIASSDGKGNLSEDQMHYRELRDAIFMGVKVQTGTDKKGKPTYKNVNVEEYSEQWFNEIMNDEFLSQVYARVRESMGENGRMASQDTKSIYPYEYWDESSTYETSSINGARYMEYCRRLGYKPKFCGKLDGKPEADFGNFTEDAGYWKTLIDRRMYAVDGSFQGLTPVTAENFTPDLVDPEVTKEEFVVTRVADEAGTQIIVDKAIAKEESRPGGIAKVDYDMTLSEALYVYNGGDVRVKVSAPSGAIDLVAEAESAFESDVRMRIIGEQAAQRLDDARKANTMMDTLATAKEMEAAGKDAKAIKFATGWERGADQLWRYEQPDLVIKAKHGRQKNFQLKRLIADSTLFTEYPILNEARVIYESMPAGDRGFVKYVDGKPEIHINEDSYKEQNPVIHKAINDFVKNHKDIADALGETKDLNALSADQKKAVMEEIGKLFLIHQPFTDKVGGRDILIHEIQHIIQHEEGFAQGGNDNMLDTTNPQTRAMVDYMRKEVDQLTAEIYDNFNKRMDLRREASEAVKRGDKEAEQRANDERLRLHMEFNRMTKRVAFLEDRLGKVKRLGIEGYRKLAGEVEARNVANRLYMSSEERRSTLLSETEDVAREDQIFLRDNLMMKSDEYKASVSFRITPEQDKAYMDAVNAGDMETAQKMVDEAAEAAGYTIRGDHGRVSKFSIFDRNKANPEGNWGQGFYFSNNEEDVENNYATVDGPDLEAKIEREVERRVNLAEMNEEFNEDGEVDEFAIRQAVEDEFITSAPNVVHAAIKMDNPFVVGHGMVEIGEDGLGHYDMQETYLTAEYETDEDGEVDHSIDPTGTLVDLVEALNDELSEYEGVNINAYGILSDNIDGMTASQFEKEARELLENSADYLLNDDLAIMTSEIIRAAIERAGFDGIVDNTVNQKFGTARRFGRAMEGVDENTRHYIAFQSSQIKETDPVTYDNEGNIIPLSERFNPESEDIRFRMSNENQAIFVSNAAKAVEGIQMGKATPEQWLKMIEKNGGLKAGEDKWMGLSDWLKSSDKKTLTKQEVLDFINENMIVIEETHYLQYAEEAAADSHREIVDKLQEKFNAYVAEYHEQNPDADEYGDPAGQYAIEKLREEMEDTFPYTIELVYGNEVYVTFDYEDMEEMEKWSEKLGVVYDPQYQINSTRLNYTTSGLDEKHEIALTVPTIESWNMTDEVHFGEAGEGRAVAWIRFGETEVPTAEYKALLDEHDRLKDVAKKTYDEFGGHSEEFHEAERRRYKIVEQLRSHNNPGRKVLVIDEIQSKRHQEGREKGYMPNLEKEYEKKEAIFLDAQEAYVNYLKETYNVSLGVASQSEVESLRAKDAKLQDLWEIMQDANGDLKEVGRRQALQLSDALSVPDAPFDKNWHELAMKRMLRYASENGFDVIAWTKGDQQAERYGIGGKVDSISSTTTTYGGNPAKEIFIDFKNHAEEITIYVDANGNVVDHGEYEGKNLGEIVGKELAVKLLAEDTTLSEDGLLIGGEGMKGFYDKMLPAFMNKYGKKWGVKVEDIELSNLEDGLTMHSVPVTDEMKASVLEGQVMFRTIPITQEVQDEMDAIKASAIVMGNYLKAPNGADTNLTPEQWAMVRTKAFKAWFGDWEKPFRLEKLRKSVNAFLKGDEIEITDDYKQNKKNAMEVGRSLKGTYTNADTGRLIELTSSKKNGGLPEILEHDYKDAEHILSIAAIPQIIENAIFIDSRENEEKAKHPNIEFYEYYVCGLTIGGEEYTVKAVVSNMTEGKRYYDHKLTSIEKGRLIDLINNKAPESSVSITTQTPETDALSKVKDKRLIPILKADFSKVIDENGEPKVVYHGGAWRPLLEEKGNAVFKMRGGMMGKGAYFTDNIHTALYFAAEKYEMENNVENVSEGFLDENGYVAEVFLNIRDEKNIRTVLEDTYYLATSPNQIKSATDNTGEFSEENDDIRFRMDSKGNTLTPAQEKFFANSKAVDKDGNLLVLYHGTPRAGFTEFKSGWFTTSKEDAISYSGDRKGRLFDPNEKYEPETLTAGDFRLGYMTFDSEEDRAAFLERFPYADEVMSEREYEDARMGAEDEEYDVLTERRKEFAEVWNAYREYERERFVDTTIGDLIANPEAYTEEDLMRAMLEYDSNASLDSLDDMDAAERKDALVSALQNANEETDGGIFDMVVPTRVPRNGEGVKHNDLGNRTYEVYANIENPYEIDANGRGSEFKSGDIYKAVEEALADEQYDGVIIRNWRVGRTQQLGDVVVPKDGSQIKLTSNENPTRSDDIRFRTTDADEKGVRFKVVTDPTKIEELEDGPKVEAYRAVQIDKNGKIYSPMASRLKSTKKGTKQATNEAAQMNQWDEAVESLDKVDENGRITILDEDGGTTKVSYNPYGHCCVNSMMNDQFKRAWERDGLYVMKVLAPESELTARYHAEKAKDAVGVHKWKTGAVGNKLPENKRREILLTRWMKNVKVMPWEAVAQDWIDTLDGENIDVPFNVVPRKILNMLAEAGVKIVAPEKGMENATKAYEQWLADPEGYVGNTELPDHVKALNEETNDEGPDNEPRFRSTGTPTDEVVANGLSLTPAQTAEVAANIFAALPEESRKKITDGLNGNVLGLKDAILQIPASLASKENWNDEDKQMAAVVRDVVQDLVDANPTTRPLTTKEALWMLYDSTSKVKDLVDAASRAFVAYNLGFDPASMQRKQEVSDYLRFRTASNGAIDAATDMYNYETSLWTERLKESWLDMNQSVKSLQEALAQASGMPVEPWENIVFALNQLSSKSYADKKKYLRDFLIPLWDAVMEIVKVDGKSIEEIERYMMLKHGLERNKKFATRDAKDFYRTMYDLVAERMKNQSHAQQVVALSEAKKKLADIDAQIAVASSSQLPRLNEARARAQYDVNVADLVLRGDEKQNETELQAYYDAIDNGADPKYREFREKDYGGLTSMFVDTTEVQRSQYKSEEAYQKAVLAATTPKFTKVADMEAEAQAEVDYFEKVVGAKNLWDKVNAATKETLRHQYESGMITIEQYEAVRDMFDFYVPLRGFADNTAEDMYSYYMNNSAGGFTKPILGAKGRKTRAESPLGWIGTMAESAIQSDNKNQAKMALYYMTLRRPDQNLLTITETWYEYTGQKDANGKKIFKAAYPPATDRALNADELRQHMEDWEDDMKKKQSRGEAYKSSQRVDLKGSVVFQDEKEEKEHVVRVKVAGKDYSILINGNPRAAQAINGLLNPDANVGPVGSWVGELRRGMSSLLTSFSPLFWVANYQRDLLSSFMRTSESEGWGDAFKYLANRRKAWRVASYIYKYENGELGNSYYENLYKEFAENGGITGYTVLTTNKEYEKLLADYAENVDKKFLNAIKGLWDKFMAFGEAIEQVSRFAAYITARESGKSIEEAVNAAKEVSVNFNRKGSAKPISMDELDKLRTKNGKKLNAAQKGAAIIFSAMPKGMKELYFFFNASVQALSSSAKLAKKSPGKAATWAGLYFGTSIAMAMINYLLAGDDDEEYLDLPDYLRHSTLLIKVSDDYYFKWSLPQEMRPFYAWADLLVSKAMGKMPHKNLGKEMALVAAQWLPVNPFEAEDPLLGLVPDYASPIAEAMANKTSFGGRIYDDMKFKSEAQREEIPAYRKATEKTGKIYVDLAELLNDISGGDEVVKGGININPSVVEHLVEGYGGGIYDFAKMVVALPGMIASDDPVEIKNIPFVNKVIMSVDETNMNSHVNDAFRYYSGIADNAKRVEKEYRESDDPSRADAYREEEDWRIYLLYKQYEQDFKDVKERLDNAVDKEEEDLLKQEQNVLREMFLDDIAKGDVPEVTFQIREDVKRFDKEIKAIMKPVTDANKERLERKNAGDVDGMLEAIERRDSLKDTPEYQRAEELNADLKVIKQQLKELGTVTKGNQRDSVIGELQKNYDAIVRKMEQL